MAYLVSGTESSNSLRSAIGSLSLAIARSNYRKARRSGLICKCVVAEKIIIRQVKSNSSAARGYEDSLLDCGRDLMGVSIPSPFASRAHHVTEQWCSPQRENSTLSAMPFARLRADAQAAPVTRDRKLLRISALPPIQS